MNTIHTRKPDYNFKEMTDEQVVPPGGSGDCTVL